MIEDFVFQGKECASLYSMKMYVDPNELESTLVCAHLISQFHLASPPPPHKYVLKCLFLSSFKPKNAVRALYSYQAVRPDELSFSKGALIYNVSKDNDDW